MKQYYFFSTVFLVFFIQNNAVSQKQFFTVKGTLTDVKEEIKVYLQYGYKYDTKVVSTHLINGAFEFKGKISHTSRAYLYIKLA